MKKSLFVLFALCLNVSFSQDAMYEICPVKNSSEVPSANLWDINGEKVDIKKVASQKPTILVFYRGGWCPYCMRHLSALAEVKNELDSMGYDLVGITPDDYTNLDSSITRSKEFDYTLLSDKEANAMDAFGISWEIDDKLYEKYKDKYGLDVEWWGDSKHHKLPVPSVFIIKEGKIQLQHVDPKYSQRLSADLLLAMLKSLE
jgi:peroxiredoxin